MAGVRQYSDKQLGEAIAGSRSWRETLRRLGLLATSSSAIRSVRHHADRLAIDYSHFTGGRRWTDADLAGAVRDADSWPAVANALQLRGGSAIPFVRRHAARLGVDTTHLGQPEMGTSEQVVVRFKPDMSNLSRAGSQMAATWFTMCGADVSWPLEPCRYDLLVSTGQSTRRVQVKTTTSMEDAGARLVHISSNGRHDRRIYTPEEIDDFFIIDGDLNFYLIPLLAVRGAHVIQLRAYEVFRVRDGSGSWSGVPHSGVTMRWSASSPMSSST